MFFEVEDCPPVEKLLPTVEAIPHRKQLRYNGNDTFSYSPLNGLNFPYITFPHLELVDLSVPACGLDILESLAAPNLKYVRLDGYMGGRGRRYRSMAG